MRMQNYEKILSHEKTEDVCKKRADDDDVQ